MPENNVAEERQDNARVSGVDEKIKAQEAAESAQFDKDWEDRLKIYKEKNGHDPDPDTDLEGLDSLISDEELQEWRNKHTPKNLFYERIRTNMPEGKYDEDEEEYFRNASSLLDKAEEGAKKYDDLTEKMMRRYQDDPEEVEILLDYMDGMPLIDAIVKHKGEEALTMHEGDEGWDSYQKQLQQRRKDREDAIARMNEIEGNMKGSVSEFESWAKENDLNEEQQQAVWKLLQGDLDNMARGKISREILGRYKNALNYDKDVAGAREQGVSEGKNAAIDVKRRQMQGSGLPSVNSSSVQEQEGSTGNSTADFLRGIKRR